MTFKHDPVRLDYEDLVCETLETGRTYQTPHGKKYPSITTVLGILSKGFIQEWRARVGDEEANRISRAAGGRGTSVHSLVDKYLKNEELEQRKIMPNSWAAFRSLVPILNARVNNIRLQERPLYSDYLGVGGRVDLVAEFDGKISIIDVKTSGRIKKAEDISSYFMQEAGYSIMFEERTGIPVSQLVTLMTVDFSTPIVFKQRRDDWAPKLINTIAEYNRQKSLGR